jgi:UPF0176 protein
MHKETSSASVAESQQASISNTPSPSNPIAVCALYKFTALEDYEQLRQPTQDKLNELSIRGTLLLAREGINGTVAGQPEAIDDFLEWLQADVRFAGIDCKMSFHAVAPFHRTKVKLKNEIVTMGMEGIDPNKVVGTYVDPEDWNELISDPNTILIDTRNEYEYGIGTFENAINPHTETFREFPDYVKDKLDPNTDKKVAMFCTGGIRCEKASAYMKEQGFDEVYHLKGGILKYLETVDTKDTLWNGECFVFDERVAVNHDLEKGQYDQCHACRYPITEEDKQSDKYTPGVSCPRCYELLTDEQKARFSERERQVQLAKLRGETHIGTDSQIAAQKHKLAKQALKKKQSKNND